MYSTLMRNFAAASSAPGRLELPIGITLGRGMDTLIDHVREEDKAHVYSLLKSTASRGQGASIDEFQTRKGVDDYLASGVSICCRDMGNDGRLFNFTTVSPSPLCRSNTPATGGGFSIFEPNYRGKGLFPDVLPLYILMGVAEGYLGTLSRTSVTATNSYLNQKKTDAASNCIGIIPDSLKAGTDSWLDDLVMYQSFTTGPSLRTAFESYGFIPKTRNIDTSFPAFNMDVAQTLCQPDISGRFSEIQNLFPSKASKVTGKDLYVELAGPGAPVVEEMIRAAAQTGEGFALDEFDQNGLLNRKFLNPSVTLVARRPSDNAVIGGAVVGPTAVGRTRQPPSLAGYVVVGEEFRRRGYGTDIVELCEGIARQLGYRNVLSDLLYNPRSMGPLRMALSHGYTVTAQFPQCAFVKDVGLTSSFVLFKSLYQPESRL